MDRLAAVYRVRDRRYANNMASTSSTRCGYCGNTVYMSNHVARTQTLDIDLIKMEDILSSVEGPLSCTST